jgi:hypothetical protein
MAWEQSPLIGAVTSHHATLGGPAWERLSEGYEAPRMGYMMWC